MSAAEVLPPPSRALWRRDDPEVVENGVDDKGRPRLRVIKGGMWPHQRAWWQLPNFVKLLVTGFGGGKTVALCKRGIALALHNAPAPHGLVSPTYAQARRTIIPTMDALLTGLSRREPSFRWRFHQLLKEWQIHYRHPTRGPLLATVQLYSGEDPSALRGPNLGSVGIDEPFLQEYEVFTQMNARTRHVAARQHEIDLTGTPESLNWGYELAEGELRGAHDVGVIHGSTRSNLLLAGAYADRLDAQYASHERAAYVEGQFVNLSTGLVYYGFQKDRNLRHVDMPNGAQLGAGMDFGSSSNYASMAGVPFWHTADGRMHVLEAHEQQTSDTPFMAGTLRDRFPDLFDVFPDASGRSRQSATGGSDFVTLGERGFTVNAPNANPDRRERYNRVNAMLESGRLTIEPDGEGCRLLVRYLQQYAHATMAKQKQMSHLLDALGYPVCYLFPAEDPHTRSVSLH